MSADTNIKTITQIYEAFGRGDVRVILLRVDPARSEASTCAAQVIYFA